MNNRELDALVAKRVMGWKDVKMGRDDYGGEPVPRKHNPINDDEWIVWMPVPAYSTDIKAAWLVVEKLLPHFRIEYYEDSDYTDKDGWHADFWLKSGHGCAQGCETAPLAICKAALKAVADDDTPEYY